MKVDLGNVFISTKELSDYIRNDYFRDKDLVTLDEIFSLLEDLACDKERLEEELEDLKRDIEDNYRPLSVREQIGYDESW